MWKSWCYTNYLVAMWLQKYATFTSLIRMISIRELTLHFCCFRVVILLAFVGTLWFFFLKNENNNTDSREIFKKFIFKNDTRGKFDLVHILENTSMENDVAFHFNDASQHAKEEDKFILLNNSWPLEGIYRIEWDTVHHLFITFYLEIQYLPAWLLAFSIMIS